MYRGPGNWRPLLRRCCFLSVTYMFPRFMGWGRGGKEKRKGKSGRVDRCACDFLFFPRHPTSCDPRDPLPSFHPLDTPTFITPNSFLLLLISSRPITTTTTTGAFLPFANPTQLLVFRRECPDLHVKKHLASTPFLFLSSKPPPQR
jgi:hypothetical protein